jgi:hypothetical protein
MATVGFQASDLFAAPAEFHAQTSSSPTNETIATMVDDLGNQQCSKGGLDTTTEYSNDFAYCNATPDIATDMNTLLTTFGDVFDSKKVVGMSINFAAGEYATLNITGHQHAENPHISAIDEGYADASAAVPSGAGFGVPTWTGQTDGADASPVSATLTFSFTHTDRVGADGDHFVGKNTLCRVELTVEWVGVPTTATATGWETMSEGGNDSNQDFDGYTYTAERYFDLTV